MGLAHQPGTSFRELAQQYSDRRDDALRLRRDSDTLPAEIVVCAAAVADWRVANASDHKMKKDAAGTPPALEPLAAVRDAVTVITGLDRKFVGGTGIHAQCGACWMSSSPPQEALDGGFPTNTTLDQLIARQIGADTLLPSLELSCDEARRAGNCDSGYSCSYQFNLAWKSETTPLAPDSPFTPAPGASSSTGTSGTPAPEADVIVEPASWEESSPKPAVPSGN